MFSENDACEVCDAEGPVCDECGCCKECCDCEEEEEDDDAQFTWSQALTANS